jgi:hypothetical protein
MPGFKGLAQLQGHTAVLHRAHQREAERPLGFEPERIEVETSPPQVGKHSQEVVPDDMGQHEAVMQAGAPAHQVTLLGLAPEPGHQGPQQQLLGQGEAGVGGHLEATEFHQPEAPGGAIGGIELVDADLGAVGVAGHVHQQVAEQPIHQPGQRRRALAEGGNHGQGDLEFVEAVVAGLIDAGSLAGGADEQS